MKNGDIGKPIPATVFPLANAVIVFNKDMKEFKNKIKSMKNIIEVSKESIELGKDEQNCHYLLSVMDDLKKILDTINF